MLLDMKLSEYMKQNCLDDAAMAARIGGCSEGAVRKWKYGERTPRPEQLARIAEATDGKVMPNDFMLQSKAASARQSRSAL